MILDSEFLLDSELSSKQAIQAIEKLVDRTLDSLHFELTACLLEPSSDLARESSQITTASTTGYQLLALTSKSNRPAVGASLVLRTILDRPEASSWHRQLLSPTILNRLSPAQAKEPLISLAEAVNVKLGVRSATGAEGGLTLTPEVKVTAIKFLAQLLRSASFVSPQDGLDILVSMLQKNVHVNVLVAVVKSMLAMLALYASDPASTLTQKILKALEALIPVVGRSTERKSIEREDWTTLPVIRAEETIPPTFDLLLERASNAELPVNVRKGLVQNILLPSYEVSKEAHHRWIKYFLLRNKWNKGTRDLKLYLVRAKYQNVITIMPPRPVVLVTMLCKTPEFLPYTYFQDWHRHSGSDTQESAIESGRDNEAERHWLHLFDQGPKVLIQFLLASLLVKGLPASLVSNGVTITFIQELVEQQARHLVHNYDKLHDSWNRFLGPLKPRTIGVGHTENWLQDCEPVIDHVIAHIDSCRGNSQWQNSQARKPSFLPSTFELELQLQLLPPYPGFGSGGKSGDQQYKDLSKDILSLLEETALPNKTYHHELMRIQTVALENLDDRDLANVACHLGNLPGLMVGSQPSTTDHLRIEIVHRMLRGAAAAIHQDPDLKEQWRPVAGSMDGERCGKV
ncbi:MAG: hypothetical protein Q9201_006814 [Fulgogasparrea decipioides]